MGALVLYVVFAPAYRVLVRRGANPGLAAGIVVVLALVLVVGPGISFVGLVANEAQGMAAGVIQSPMLARLREAGDVDALYLDLHGAMVTASLEDGEGETDEEHGYAVPVFALRLNWVGLTGWRGCHGACWSRLATPAGTRQLAKEGRGLFPQCV